MIGRDFVEEVREKIDVGGGKKVELEVKFEKLIVEKYYFV